MICNSFRSLEKETKADGTESYLFPLISENTFTPADALTTSLQALRSHLTPVFSKPFGVVTRSNRSLEANKTLYSFRHTGAIEVFKKTKEIAIVQQVMARQHASYAGVSAESGSTCVAY
jgi:hypothetical protein